MRNTLLWFAAAFLLAVLVLALMGTLETSPDDQQSPDVLLVTIDTLRADSLSIYGAVDVATPSVEELANHGTTYHRAMTPMPLTRPAHFSLFTALYPREHGVLNNTMDLPDHATTLAQSLSKHGYCTAGFVGVQLLAPPSGAARGFETFEFPRNRPQARANRVVARALRWVRDACAHDPVFMWVHLFDPHQPYDPPDEFRRNLDPELNNSLHVAQWETLDVLANKHDGDIPRDVLRHVARLYRGEVEYTDYWIGRLLTGFAAARERRNTMVILTADHGECFEHGIYFEHADCLFDGAVHVPLIIRFPGQHVPTQVHTMTSLLDIAPTILREVGIPLPLRLSGMPLQDGADSSRFVLLQQPFYPPAKKLYRQRAIRSVGGTPVRPIRIDTDAVGIVDTRWKYVRSGGTDELFAMRPTPIEGLNRAAEEGETVVRLRAALDAELRIHPMTELRHERINPELRATLSTLGYLQ